VENETEIMQYISYWRNIYNEFLEVLSYMCFFSATQMFKRLIAIRCNNYDLLINH